MADMILQGDCLKKLKELEDNSVDAVMTDPPYNLSSIQKRFGKEGSAEAQFGNDGSFRRLSKGFMGKEWDNEIAFYPDIWKECLRVLKPGGHLLSFGGTRTYHRMACAIEDAGFEVRDMIEWVYGSGFPKSLNIGKAVDKLQGNEREELGRVKRTGKESGTYGQFEGNNMETKGTSEWEGWGTALKPAHEPICMARKPLGEKSVAENVLKHGTGGINIDESRVGTSKRVPGSLPNPENRGQIFNRDKGKSLKQSGHNPNIGRFPSNLIHDNSQEVRECFPETKAGVAVRRNGNNAKGIFPVKIAEGSVDVGFNDSGNASRFFKSIIYIAKASKSERNMGCEGLEEKFTKTMNDGIGEREHNEDEPTAYNQNNHPTVKPIALMEYLIKMICPKGGTVLDPFMGSGSTGVACKKNGYQFIGIERESEYCKIAEARIKATKVENKLL